MQIRIRSFRAIDDVEACLRYAEGHRKILEIYGVSQVTSANLEWILNPLVYVIQAETMDGKTILGGVRIHMAGASPLPLEEAIQDIDPSVSGYVSRLAIEGTAELCGLWNAKEVAGYGIGTFYLMRAGISVVPQLHLGSLLALCAQHTLEISTNKGFEIATELGLHGTFYYPSEDLVATSLILKDPHTLAHAQEEERAYILDLRCHPQQTRIEQSPRGTLEIEYNLLISNVPELVQIAH